MPLTCIHVIKSLSFHDAIKTTFKKESTCSSIYMRLKGHLHGRKIRYRPVKKVVWTSHFCSCKQSVPCFGGCVRTRVFSGFGAIDVYGPKTRKNTGPYSFLNAYVSLRNNFADNMRSKKTVWLWGQEMERVPGYTEVFKPFIVRE